MSSSDYPALRMTVDGGRLVPSTPFDQERINSYRRGATVLVKITEQKDRVLQRKWWAILGLVLKQCKTPWKTKEEAHEAIKLALGIVNLSKTVSGAFMQYPKSLSELDDPELQEALEQMIELLSRLTGVDVETLNKEAAHVGSEINQDTGETSQALPDTDGEGSASIPDPSDDEVAGVMSPPAPATSDTIDAAWLKTAARMLWGATNWKGDTEANLGLLNTQHLAVADLDDTKGVSQRAKDKAGSIYRTCKSAVMQEVDPTDALKMVAGLAGTTEAAITGKEDA